MRVSQIVLGFEIGEKLKSLSLRSLLLWVRARLSHICPHYCIICHILALDCNPASSECQMSGMIVLRQFSINFLILKINYTIVYSNEYQWRDARSRWPPIFVYIMTSSNGNISRVTDFCAGNSPVKNPVTWSFDVFFDLRLNQQLSKQCKCRWFEKPSRSLRRHS